MCGWSSVFFLLWSCHGLWPLRLWVGSLIPIDRLGLSSSLSPCCSAQVGESHKSFSEFLLTASDWASPTQLSSVLGRFLERWSHSSCSNMGMEKGTRRSLLLVAFSSWPL